jgi:hypothetical protein
VGERAQGKGEGDGGGELSHGRERAAQL